MELWPPPPARAPPLDCWGWGGRSGPGRLRLRGARGGAGSHIQAGGVSKAEGAKEGRTGGPARAAGISRAEDSGGVV